MHAITVGVVVNALSGLLMVALGVFVLRVKRDASANRAFALFAILFGSLWIVNNLFYETEHWRIPAGYLSGFLGVGASVALVWTACVYPVPFAGGERRPVAVALTVGGATVMVFWFVHWVAVRARLPLPDAELAGPLAAQIVYNTGTLLLLGLGWGILFLLALRRRTVPGNDRLLVLVSIAFVPYFAFATGQIPGFWAWAKPEAPWFGLAFFALLLVIYAVVWSVAAPPRAERRMRLGWWLPVFAVLVGLVSVALIERYPNNPGFGLSRIFMVAVLAYAIVKHQLLGIDLKVRWGVSKSVLAGIFLAVFFVVVELGKWAAERVGNVAGMPDPSLLGIAAAGLLLFAIAPLHRLADRIAARAVPLAEAPVGGTGDRREESYRRVLRRFLADGIVTRDEERALAELAADLGIDAGRAFVLREEAEGERPVRRRRGPR